MLAVEVDLLTGRYTASRYDDRSAHEWPPHPGRLFSALVAVWADDDEPDPAERAALEWLEEQAPPAITASGVAVRAPNTHFVPDNDVAAVQSPGSYDRLVLAELAARGGEAKAVRSFASLQTKAAADSLKAAARSGAATSALEVLPEQRGRQGRSYPTVRPDDPKVVFTWREATPLVAVRASLDSLLRRVWRLGHSSTLVACRLVDEAPAPTHVPSDGGEPLRVPVPGLLAELRRQFQRHQGSEPRILPSAVHGYRTASRTAARPPVVPLLGGEWFVLAKVGGPAVPVHAALELARATRAALLSHAPDPSPEVLSGHAVGVPGEQTGPTARPHLAIVPLPFVGHGQADGHVLGVALVLPRDTSPSDRAALLTSLGRWRNDERRFVLRAGRLGRHELVLSDELESRQTLQRRRWCRAATRWATASPLALDRFPGDLGDADPVRAAVAEEQAQQLVSRACEHAGLPAPINVVVSRAAFVTGVPPVRRFPSYRVGGGSIARVGIHVSLAFDAPVSGPVLLGSGRYLGRGLFLPLDDEAARD